MSCSCSICPVTFIFVGATILKQQRSCGERLTRKAVLLKTNDCDRLNIIQNIMTQMSNRNSKKQRGVFSIETDEK